MDEGLAATDPSCPPPAGGLRAVVVTYRRPEVDATLDALERQTLRPARTYVIDNAADAELAARCARRWTGDRGEYVAAPANLGPAGGLRLGIERALDDGFDGWVVLVDDDDPPATEHVLRQLAELIARCDDPSVGGVGLSGARFDRRRALMRRLTDDQLAARALDVDAIGGNQFPMYRAAALREVGGPDPELFWGYEELELGLRLRQAGWRLVIDGEVLRGLREHFGRLGLRSVAAGDARDDATWRRYYYARNLAVVCRRHATAGAVVVAATRSLAGALARCARRRDRLAIDGLVATVRGLVDGLAGRMGRRVEPA